jgi:SAM-dependent methyltransferase
MSSAEHWDAVWADRDPDLVTWFQATPARSLELITSVSSADDAVVDVGGGASRLVDHLLDLGYTDLTVVDIAESALAANRARLGSRADRVTWVAGDVLDVDLGPDVAVWHDRAVFHFLVDPPDRAAYVARVRATVRAGGHVVMATFGPDGPETCSGLPTCRYDPSGLATELGDGFELVDTATEEHVSPAGVSQEFVYVLLRRLA